MTQGSPDPDPDGTDERAEEARRRRRAEVFGEVLPDATRDERDQGAGGGAASEAWLRDNIPPHHT